MVISLKNGNWKILLINKPKGILSNNIKNKPNLQDRLSSILGELYSPINRLDRMTDGWIAFCNSIRLKKRIKKYWNNSIREYLLMSSGKISLGLHKFYCKKYGHIVHYRNSPFQGAKLCTSQVLYCIKINNCFLVKVRNYTGFTHQVRILIRLSKNYIIGENLYSRKVPDRRRLQLSAVRLKIGPFEMNDKYYSINVEGRLTSNIMKTIIDDYRGLVLI